MRLTFTIFCLFVLNYNASATRFTVSNSNARPAQFTQPQEAVNAAEAGDTILIYSTNVTYASFRIDKSIAIIGEGYSMDDAQRIAGTIDIVSVNDVVIKNLSFASLRIGILGNTGQTIQNLEVDNCMFSSFSIFNRLSLLDSFRLNNCIIESIWSNSLGGPIRNAVIANNVLNNIVINPLSENIIIANNIFRESSSSSSSRDYIAISNSISVFISNNVFLAKENSNEAILLANSPQGVSVANNIFNGAIIDDSRPCTGCIFRKNLSSDASITTLDPDDNIIGEDPQFLVDPANPKAWELYDFRLAETSPAKGASTDGGDLGIFAGSAPMPFPYIFGLGSLPRITDLLILDQIVDKDGTLEVEIEATSSKF